MTTSVARSRETRVPAAAPAVAAVVGLIVVGALLRFWRIGHQSLWLDEAYTVDLVRRGFGGMLSTIPHTESTPPLYYVLAWLWARVFGVGAAGLRSLSAVAGTATIPVAYVAARRLFSERAALAAAALVAVNPYFVWYSQEARAYSLLVLMSALSLVAFANVLRERTARAAYAWGAVAALALLTHYFAAFVVVPEGLWLAYTTRARWMLAASAIPLACAAALTPLALAQRRTGHAQWIGAISLGRRLADLPRKFVTGELGLPLPVLGALAGAIVLAALAWSLARYGRQASLMLGLAAAAVVIPLVLAAAGADYVFARNLIALYVPLALAAAAGFAAAGRPGAAGLGCVCLVALVVNGFVAYDPKLERDDWRGLVRTLGPASGARAIVLGPAVQEPPLALYAGRLEAIGPAGASVREIDALLITRPPRTATPPAPPGFALAGVKSSASWTLVRYVAARPASLSPAQLAALRLGSEPAGLFLELPARARSGLTLRGGPLAPQRRLASSFVVAAPPASRSRALASSVGEAPR